MTLVGPQEVRKKQLGQYFTGQRVGRLLAALANADQAERIIDPMVGSADLLVACLSVGARPEKMVGLELDPLAFAAAHEAFNKTPGVELILSDAFRAKLPPEQFDLVITNPPYIRYQSKADVEGIDVPSAASVRAGLVRAVGAREGLSEDARAAFLHAAHLYPGTSDVAVPAWILSAALVREGGMLAVVAPQAWLSRNYAHAVRELLDAAFELEIIVDDGDASWFGDALVRTQLVVARRREVNASGAAHSAVLARATSDLDTHGSLVGRMPSERAVAKALRAVKSPVSVSVTTGLSAHIEHDLSVAARGRNGHVPARVAAALSIGSAVQNVRTLESYGWRCGQGLRTGANDFFYVSVVDGDVRPADRWGHASLAIPGECLLPAVRRQGELGDEQDLSRSPLPTSRVVNLRGWVTEADFGRMRTTSDVCVLPSEVGRWIAQVAEAPLSTTASSKRFPELTAVAPNSKVDSVGAAFAFWYQLPPMAPRHIPELFIPRVCGGRPLVYRNSVHAVIDANFSTLWPVEANALPVDAMLALLSSSWVWASLEASCTVLGGGALKVEATDLRRLGLPDVDRRDEAVLSALGQRLRSEASDGTASLVDAAVARILVPTSEEPVDGLHELATRLLEQRLR